MVAAVSRFVTILVVTFGLAFGAVGAAQGQDGRQNRPGQFDFYVLSLSWSPSFCASAAERSPGRAPNQECSAGSYSFIVHGLWPQYDKGFPQFCQVPAPRLDRATISSMLDLMPAPRLIFAEWDRHGTCSGLTPAAYFDLVRKARAVVKIPPQYLQVQQPLTVSPASVEAAFAKENAGLGPADMAIACDSKRLTEVRICLSKDFKFRGCPDVVQHGCQRDQVVMPPQHGSTASSGDSG